MPTFGLFCSMEEFTPRQCLDQAVAAEDAGYDSVWVNDHFHPWFDHLPDGTKASGGNAWAWMPAALERTDDVQIGTGVSAVLNRYHPAAVAQRYGTMCHLHPDRLFLGIGTGEAFNELPLGYPWPEYSERAQRTAEAIRIFRRLFEEEFVDFDGQFWTLDGANLYTAPDEAPPVHVAAGGPTSARMAGDLGDGLVMANADLDHVRDEILPSMKRGIKRSERNETMGDLDRVLHIHCSYADTIEEALEPCKPWRTTMLPEMRNLGDPRYLQEHGEKVDTDHLLDAFVVFTDPADLIEATQDALDAGFTHIVYQSSSPDQARFIDMTEREVLPSFA